jgi:uncharacterized OB-fold protein
MSLTDYMRPAFRMLPEVTADSRDFWTGGARNELRIHRCNGCGRLFHPPAPACFRCRSTDVESTPVSGRARVAGFTVTHHQWFEGFPPPYVIAIVELDDQPDVRLTTNIIGCRVDAVRVGMPVEAVFEHWSDDHGEVWIPLFRPVEERRR